MSGQFVNNTSSTNKARDPRPTVTGLYNWSRDTAALANPDHSVGYVTRLGDNSHPRKDPDFTFTRQRSLSESRPTRTDIEDPTIHFPGDYHLRPHEWSYLVSKMKIEKPQVAEETQSSHNETAVSVPTTIVRGVDRDLRAQVRRQREFMNRIGSNKWYHPLSSNDVSAYGNAYVRSMNCGPFNKTQLLVSR